MKRIITITLLFLHTIGTLTAQKLENKIPNDVDVVITSNAKNLFELISIEDIDENSFGKMILKELNSSNEEQINSIENLGIDLKSNAYYFFKNKDTLKFHSFFVELKNKKEFEAILPKRKIEKIQQKDGYSYIEDYKSIMVWNNEYLLFVGAHRSDDVDEAKKYAFNILRNNTARSISTNKKFQSAKQKNAVMTVWVRDYGSLMTDLIYSLNDPMFYGMDLNNKDLIGISEMSANLFFEKNNTNLKIDVTLNDEMKDAFKKMYNQKMSTNLLKNLNAQKALAFFSVSVNTEEVLLQYPTLVKKMYGNILPNMEQEIALGTDLFSLLIDEEAIGELITGDALFVLDDVSKKEVVYTSYEYDEDYNRKEIEKTKEETLPGFTFMLGTKRGDLLKKFFQIGEKYKVIDEQNNVYQFVDMPKSFPLELYALIKDDVLYFTTSKEKAKGIYNNAIGNASSEYAKMVRKNSSVLYFNIHKTMGEFSEIDLSRSDKKIFDFGYDNLKDACLTASKIKGNKISTELKLNTGEGNENSLKLILDFFDYMMKK